MIEKQVEVFSVSSDDSKDADPRALMRGKLRTRKQPFILSKLRAKLEEKNRSM